MAVLTPDEEKEFTVFNACAFDLARVTAQSAGKIPPVWLCTSGPARQRYRAALFQKLRADVALFRNRSEAFIEAEINRAPGMQAFVEIWREAELHCKQDREAGGNPLAFFACNTVEA